MSSFKNFKCFTEKKLNKNDKTKQKSFNKSKKSQHTLEEQTKRITKQAHQ